MRAATPSQPDSVGSLLNARFFVDGWKGNLAESMIRHEAVPLTRWWRGRRVVGIADEPEAGKRHVRVRAGGAGQLASLRQRLFTVSTQV